MDTCPYFSFMSLDEALDAADSDNLLVRRIFIAKIFSFMGSKVSFVFMSYGKFRSTN